MAEAILKKLFNDPKTGLLSANKLWRKAKKIDNSITEKVVREFLDKQATTQINRAPRRKKFHNIVAHYVNNGWQMDLIDLSKYSTINKNFKWLLTIIDIYSRRAWAIPLKTKSGPDVASALKKIFDAGHTPKQVSSDLGKEFLNHHVQDLFKKHDIKHWTYEPMSHNTLGIIERFNRTIRTMLRKYWAAYDTRQWINVIDDLMSNYNTTYHRTIDATPMNVYTNVAYPKPPKKANVVEFDVGDHVRKKTVLTIFDKPTERY